MKMNLLVISFLVVLTSCGRDGSGSSPHTPQENDIAVSIGDQPRGMPVVLEDADLSIWGGTVSAPTSVAAKTLVPLYFLASDGLYYMRCSGSVLSSTKILTAAHCVSTADKNAILALETAPLAIGVGGTSAYIPTVILPVSKFAVDPGYRMYRDAAGSLFMPNDVAVLTLSSPIPTSLGKVPASLTTKRAAKNTSFTAAGYGMQILNTSPDGKLYQASLPVIGFDAVGSVISSAYGRGTCKGDSGGPLFKEVNGKMVIYGVLSWGIQCQYNPSLQGHWDVVRSSIFIKSQMQ